MINLILFGLHAEIKAFFYFIDILFSDVKISGQVAGKKLSTCQNAAIVKSKIHRPRLVEVIILSLFMYISSLLKCKSLTNDDKNDYAISIEIIIDLHMQFFISILLLAREQK